MWKRLKKKYAKLKKNNGLNITAEGNKKVVDFLGLNQPYKKPNSIINYINHDSNHLPPFIRNLSKGIEYACLTAPPKLIYSIEQQNHLMLH